MNARRLSTCLVTLGCVLSDISVFIASRHPIYSFILRRVAQGIREINQRTLQAPEVDIIRHELRHELRNELRNEPDPPADGPLPVYNAGPDPAMNYHAARQIQQELDTFDLVPCPTLAAENNERNSPSQDDIQGNYNNNQIAFLRGLVTACLLGTLLKSVPKPRLSAMAASDLTWQHVLLGTNSVHVVTLLVPAWSE
ncbi:hypothetical protein GGS21DRAFT_492332 [Xylaria nigripes]|nr:hypothetical protein GGS21DRAFT_492332 [Xylaria nigripes]